MQDPIEQTLDALFGLYHRHGAGEYIGEPVTQLEHMAQAAQLAQAAGHDEEMVLAAFFHDIGHLCAGETAAHMDGYGVQDHERLGADYLQRAGFSDTVVRLVASHVPAKRYLTYRHPEYNHNLSEASRRTLAFQGGPMTAAEAAAFEADPLFPLYLALRRFDEQAKQPHTPLPDLNLYSEMARRHLAAQGR